MKHVLFYTLAAGLVFGAGCSKKEDPAPKEITTKTTVAQPAQTITKDLTQKAEAVTAQVTGKVAAVTAQAQAATKDITQKAQAAVQALTVKPEAVMADLNLPVADLKAKVANYGQPELLGYANAYKEVILAKKEQLAGLTSSLKGLPMADMLGEKGKAIKDQLTQYTSQLAGLRERYGVYLDMLKKFGVDLSSFGL
jgi:hypothetical protein